MVTEKGPQTTTNLLVRDAKSVDSGTYSCNPSSAPSAKVTVHILNGTFFLLQTADHLKDSHPRVI